MDELTVPKDYRVTLKVRNNRLLRAIEDVGGEPGGKWCEANGLSYTQVNDLINMTASPITTDHDLRPIAIRLCEVLKKLPTDLWSVDQLCPLETNTSEMEMSRDEITALLPNYHMTYLPDFSSLENAQIRRLLNDALSTLKPREREILSMRFDSDLTYDDIAEKFKISKERIRQIEINALRKLRHPMRVGIIADCVGEEVLDAKERQKAKDAARHYYKDGLHE